MSCRSRKYVSSSILVVGDDQAGAVDHEARPGQQQQHRADQQPESSSAAIAHHASSPPLRSRDRARRTLARARRSRGTCRSWCRPARAAPRRPARPARSPLTAAYMRVGGPGSQADIDPLERAPGSARSIRRTARRLLDSPRIIAAQSSIGKCLSRPPADQHHRLVVGRQAGHAALGRGGDRVVDERRRRSAGRRVCKRCGRPSKVRRPTASPASAHRPAPARRRRRSAHWPGCGARAVRPVDRRNRSGRSSVIIKLSPPGSAVDRPLQAEAREPTGRAEARARSGRRR